MKKNLRTESRQTKLSGGHFNDKLKAYRDLHAHALFSRPMVVSPKSEIVIDLESDSADLNADGLRRIMLELNDRVILTSDQSDVKLAHIKNANFADRLVAKFKLPVEGWRG